MYFMILWFYLGPMHPHFPVAVEHACTHSSCLHAPLRSVPR